VRKNHVVFQSLMSVICLLVFGYQVAVCLPQGQNQVNSVRDEHLRKFLQSYLGAPTEETKATRYSAAYVDLRGDGKREAIVYVTGAAWCGTGGCTMLVIASERASYNVVAKIPAVRPPIAVLAEKSNGWHDIRVVTGKPLYETILSFDGQSYPNKPAGQLRDHVPGRTVISEATEKVPLYQSVAQ